MRWRTPWRRMRRPLPVNSCAPRRRRIVPDGAEELLVARTSHQIALATPRERRAPRAPAIPVSTAGAAIVVSTSNRTSTSGPSLFPPSDRTSRSVPPHRRRSWSRCETAPRNESPAGRRRARSVRPLASTAAMPCRRYGAEKPARRGRRRSPAIRAPPNARPPPRSRSAAAPTSPLSSTIQKLTESRISGSSGRSANTNSRTGSIPPVKSMDTWAPPVVVSVQRLRTG